MGVVQKAINNLNSRLEDESASKGPIQQGEGGGGGSMVVHFTGDYYAGTATADKTFEEVYASLPNVIGILDDQYAVYCARCQDTEVVFEGKYVTTWGSASDPSGGPKNMLIMQLTFNDNDTVEYKEGNINLTAG